MRYQNACEEIFLKPMQAWIISASFGVKECGAHAPKIGSPLIHS
jgi:hypothetical protein